MGGSGGTFVPGLGACADLRKLASAKVGASAECPVAIKVMVLFVNS